MTMEINILKRNFRQVNDSNEGLFLFICKYLLTKILDFKFSLMQWNSLADYLSDAFPHSDPKILKWNYRFPLIIEEIQQYSSDLISMEEVDHFDDLYKRLQTLGYKGLFQKKNGSGKDGSAFFYKENKFVLICNIWI